MEAMRCMVPRQTGTLDREPRAIGSGDEAVERFARGRRAGPLDDEQQDNARSEAFLARRKNARRKTRAHRRGAARSGWVAGGQPLGQRRVSRSQNLRDPRPRAGHEKTKNNVDCFTQCNSAPTPSPSISGSPELQRPSPS